jgi:hypothetical protein
VSTLRTPSHGLVIGVLFLVALGLGACSGSAVSCSPEVKELPCTSGVKVGKSYRYQLYTHCGVRWAYFDQRWWSASPILDDGNSNPPPGWGNPFDNGAMKLISEERAVFTNHAGQTAEFKSLPRNIQEFPGEVCR